MSGTIGGRYELLRPLGEGGWGVVHEARHLETGRHVAVKLLRHKDLVADAVTLARFQREARATAALPTAHIVEVLDAGKDEASGVPFLVMELLDGEDVEALLRRLGPLPPTLALRIAAQVCVALDQAHAAGVIHRDIKPSNIVVTREGAERVVKVVDFGIAKTSATRSEHDLTRAGTLLGSPRYMSPEQVTAQRDLDPRADIWSLGIVLYKTITGRSPYPADLSLGDLILAICGRPAEPLSKAAPWVPETTAAIVDRAIRIDREERFATAAEMLTAIEGVVADARHLDESMLVGLEDADLVPREPTQGVTAATVIQPARRRRRWLFVAAVPLVLGGWFLLRGAAPSSPPPAPAVAAAPPPPVPAQFEPEPPRTVSVKIAPSNAVVTVDNVKTPLVRGAIVLSGPVGKTVSVHVASGTNELTLPVTITESGAAPAKIELTAQSPPRARRAPSSQIDKTYE